MRKGHPPRAESINYATRLTNREVGVEVWCYATLSPMRGMCATQRTGWVEDVRFSCNVIDGHTLMLFATFESMTSSPFTPKCHASCSMLPVANCTLFFSATTDVSIRVRVVNGCHHACDCILKLKFARKPRRC